MKRNLIVLVSILCFTMHIFGQDNIKVMYYNILDYPLVPTASQAPYLKTIFDYYHPDVLVCDEVSSDAIAIDILNNVINITTGNTYAKAAFVDGPDKDNMLFYNLAKLKLKSQDTIQTAQRLINRYRLYHNTTTADTVFLDFYAAHLKASSGADNELKRYQECVHFKNYIATETQGHNIILGGDFNLYTSAEAAYQLLLSPANYPMFDPINTPGVWDNSLTFAPIHTQSSRTTAFGGGATGGMDSRFDFILVTNDLLNTANNAYYISGTYKALGNDGLHLNKALIETPISTTVPAEVTNALYLMSDHLPVVMELSVNVNTALPEPTNYPATFSATNIRLQWNDAIGPNLPSGYLARMSSVSFDAILPPTDGIPVADSPTDKNAAYGKQEAWFTNLTPNTTYYFKIYGYTGTGSNINYKTDGTIPQVLKITTP